MPDYKPNQFVRAFAVLALVAALVAVVAVVATTTGGSDNGGGNGSHAKAKGPSKRGGQALDPGAWVVRSGDTLGKISEEPGTDIHTLMDPNPNPDPPA